jgi:hypothetical protein
VPITAIKTEGGLLPREVLARVAAEDADLPGMEQQAYHLPPNERLGEAINRSWNRLLGLWEAYSEALNGRPENDAATGLTRDRWLLPLFDELGYGRLQRSTAVEIEGKSFAISHAWYRTPIHLVGAGVSIDKRSAGVAGAAAGAPHSLVQEFLNRSEEHLWAFVSNGRLLRILRDNHSLSRQAYVEFELEAIMDGELFSDFRVLWLVCHQSRVEAEQPEDCLLEAWFQQSREEGVRALDALRDGVERAIEAFGSGFLRHPANGRLHEGLRSGELDRQDYYRELLRLVYRLIFLFVAEDRDALLDPNAPQEARQRYTKFYASNRLRELAGRRRGTAHDDFWRGLRLVLSKLHDGSPDLGLPALGSFLWSPESVEWIGGAELRNDDLLTALRALSYTTQDHQLLAVNWRTLGSEELGSVYESLLELHPKMNREAGTFELDTAAGHERKTTGSYYTPTSLVDRLLDSALEPVLEQAMRADEPEAALLGLKVCDTAAGSGHFLVAAARRIALRLASVRTGDEEASPEAVTHALRDVVGRCIYGVDLNPLAVELCKVSLWMEALEPGKPLSFLDHHIQLGNSLLGTTPHLLREGVPDDAFKEIEGDDKKIVRDLRKQNRDERNSEQIGFHTQMVAEPGARYGAIETLLAELSRADDSTLDAVQRKEERYRRLLDDPRYRAERLAADAWCAAFVWRKTGKAPPAVTEDLFRQIQRQANEVPAAVALEVRRLADRYRFFHFHLAFPDVFRSGDGGAEGGEGVTGWPGGFDVVLGNPPWERIKLQEKEWFAERSPEIAGAPNAAKRRKLIAALEEDDPDLFESFVEARRLAEGESHIVRDSGRYPFCGRGDVNTYSIFAEGNRQILAPRGRMGIIVPSGIATDATTQYFFQDLMDSASLISLYDFENRAAIFPGVHRSYKFCLLTIAGGAHEHDSGAEFAFFLQSTKQLDDEERRFRLSAEEVTHINPESRTCPVIPSRRDKELLLRIHTRAGTLGSSEWEPYYMRFVHLGDHADEVIPATDLTDRIVEPRIQPADSIGVYEAKLVHIFDHRFATFNGTIASDAMAGQTLDVAAYEKQDPTYEVGSRYFVADAFWKKLSGKYPWALDWQIGYRDVCRSTDERTVIASAIPRQPTTVSMPCLGVARADLALFLLGNLGSFALDYAARLKVPGIHLTFTVLRQLPVLAPATYEKEVAWWSGSPVHEWLLPRMAELTCTSRSLSGVGGPSALVRGPFMWLSERREMIRAEIDAAYFHLYGLSEGDLDYIMDTFPIVKRKDEATFGEYRTKRLILEIYQAMARATRTGRPYHSQVDPPPADPALAHASAKEREDRGEA